MSAALSNASRSPFANPMLLGIHAPAKPLLAAAMATVFTAMLLPATGDPPALTTQDAMRTAADNGHHSSTDRALHALNSSPIYFETNRGQWGPSIRYTTQGDNHAIAFGARSMLLHVGTGDSSATATLHFRGANPAPTLAMSNLASANSATANASAQVDTIAYKNVYPGIDVVFHGTKQQDLAYDFVIVPHADPNQIAFEYRGADTATIEADGALTVVLGDEVIKQTAPRVFQTIDNLLVPVPGQFVKRPDHTIVFSTQL